MSSGETAQDVFDACAHCGAPFEREIRYPAQLTEGPDGESRLYSFCDAECQRAWNEEP